MKAKYEQLTEAIRAAGKRLLAEGAVQRVIGYEASELAMRGTPLIARTPEEVDRLVWHAGCGEDLATYLKTGEGRCAVAAKGCDTRAIVTLIQEQQIKREDVVIIGVPCDGVFDFHKIEKALDFEELVSGDDADGANLVVRSASNEATMPRADALYAGCLTCEYPTPVIYDELIGDAVEAKGEGCDTAAVDAIEAMPTEEKWDDFESNLANCIRCYACRNACPMCYCAVCFTERAAPAWLGTTSEPADAQLYHLVRAMHLGSRCVDCGACNRACPQGIDLRRLNKKLEKESREMFDHVPGVEVEALPAMATYDENDPEDFMLEG